MATLSQVIDQMTGSGLPALPAGHPILDGNVKRFGPKRKAWYALREVRLASGACVVSGAFGIWQGTNNNAVPVTMDWNGVTPEERAEAERKQAAHDAAETEKRARAAEMAANRARMQWGDATPVDETAEPVGYLARKQIPGDAVRVNQYGELLIPMRKYSRDGVHLVGLQKISPDGEKRFTKNMDKAGSACLLGPISADTPVIGIGEGYATCQSVRIACDYSTPLVVAFDAGNLTAVARQLRTDFPDPHFVFFADDDWRLEPRYRKLLLDEFDVADAPAIDGADHRVPNAKGEGVTIRATWRKDATGTDYIEMDVRAGRAMRIIKIENAGISRARAAAAAVGNSSVVWPLFAARGDNGWSDFNDLQVEESREAVRAQVQAALLAAASSRSSEGEAGAGSIPPSHPVEAASEPAPVSLVVPSLEVLVEHFAVVYPTTDVWDALRKQRMKRSAFVAWVGKEKAGQWDKDPKRRTILRETLPTLIGGRAVDNGAGGSRLNEMLEHLTLLRGTETVWDGIGQQVMSLGAVRADYTTELTSKWQEHAMRKTIEARNLVFDPTQQADPETHVNIFLGWPLVPKGDDQLVQPILALLSSLCSAEDRVDDAVLWILRWLAYPLQHPGAKMQTALLMFGEMQGTGKSLFFQDVIMPIYGEYGTVASQHQLDSTFTAWRSRKLFVLFEEVLSRDDKYSHNGTLKYMVTGKQMSINQKNLPERTERNHMNSVFLSNEPQPIPIELEDRRFMVIEARCKQPKEFYDAVQESISRGGIEAFYHFLLNIPLDDFNEHTKPPMTLAKERVIEFGLNGWMSFHRAWKEGSLAAPYCSCLTEDLYIVYKRWCDKSGEKPLTLCKFSGLIASREHKVKRAVSVGGKMKATRMIFEVKALDEDETVEKQIERFRKVADVRAEGSLQG